MGYIKVKLIKRLVGVVALSFCLTACGAAENNCDVRENAAETKADVPKTVVGENSSGNGEGDEGIQKTEKPEGIRIKVGNMDKTASGTDTEIPVYGAEEKEAIREYLAKMPDDYLSFRKAKKLGIIREGHVNRALKQKEKEYFGERWLSFYSNAKESQEILEGKREKDIGTKYEDAIVIVCYTTEGDPIYKYISYSYRDGKFYLYEDASRDRFGCRSSEEEGFHGSYGDIKWLLPDGQAGSLLIFIW